MSADVRLKGGRAFELGRAVLCNRQSPRCGISEVWQATYAGPLQLDHRNRSMRIRVATQSDEFIPKNKPLCLKDVLMKHSVVPRGTSFHHAVELEHSSIAFYPDGPSCRHLPGPAELSAFYPDAMHDRG